MNTFSTKLLLNGQWLEGSGASKLVVTNPATEENFAEVSSATVDEIGQAAEAGQAASRSRRGAACSGSAASDCL